MEQFTLTRDDLETTAVKIKLPQQVMIEKWKLVLLIVGCTSFLFLIYFPIDFFLYRRRKRMARERHHQSACRSSPVRAAQCHAKVTPPDVSAEAYYGELDEIEQRKYRAQRGVIKFLNMLKMKKSSAAAIEKSIKTETLSSAKSSSPRVNIIPEPEIVPSVNGSVQFLSEFEVSSNHKSNYKSYEDDYLDYTPEKKVTKTTKTWNENREVYKMKRKKSHLGVKFDKKMSKFAAFQQDNVESPPSTSRRITKIPGSSAMGPLENTTDFLVNSTDNEYFNNSMQSSYEYLDSKINNHGDCKNNADKLNNISKIHREVLSETINLSSAKDLSEDASDRTTSGVDNNEEIMKEYVKDDAALVSETRFNKQSEPFVRYKKLNHTQSELCMVRKSSLKKLSFKHGRKRNIISPLCTDTFTEQMNLEESSSSDKSLPISIPIFAEYSETEEVKRKKKKKPLLRKECSGSMPDLFYKSKEFNNTNL